MMGRQITRPMQDAIDALMAGQTMDEAAAAIGVTLRTVQKWSRTPRFQIAVNGARLERRQNSAAVIEALIPVALDRLSQIIADDAISPATHVRACNSLLDRGGIARLATHEVRRGAALETVSPAEATAAKIDDIRRDLALLREEGKLTGLAPLHRLEGELMDQHAAALREEADANRATVDDDEALRDMRELVDQLPQAALDQLAAIIEAARFPNLRVVDNG